MKRFFFALIITLIILPGFAQDPYSRIKLYAGQEDLLDLASNGLIIDHGEFKAGVYVIFELSQAELAIIDGTALNYEMLIPDVSRFYRERNEPFLSRLDEVKRMEYALSRDWPVPDGFELGSCGGFLTIDQCMDHLDQMAAMYPNLISTRDSLDYITHNGRRLYWVRLSDNPNTDEDETEVLYTGMHHAREPIGMQLLIYYMYYLLENYETDPQVQYIVDNFELYFVPIINPDGYAYNIQNEPGGGGNWRKNRRQNEDGSYGVDINRNYGYMWGYNNSGSSPDPWDDTYRGPSPFSEPATMCIRDFCEAHEFIISLNYHSYSNLLLYPWGWTSNPCEHDAIFNAHSEILTTENGYEYGAGSTTIYPTNGGSDDWMYGEQETKNLSYSYTPEVGGGSDGFWPYVSRIIPLCQENMYQNIMAANLSGPWAEARDLSPSIIENKTGLFFYDLQRLGLKDEATYTVSIEALNDAIATISAPMVYNDLEILETVSGAFTYILKEDILSGEEVAYLLSVNNGLATFSDTIRKIYGTPVVIFQDSASNFTNWSSPKWNTTTAQYHSPTKSIADSPFGQYANYENNIMTLNNTIDLTGYVYASLGFWAKWDIEAGYDYVQVLVSDDDGGSWTPVDGKYTHPGTSNQAYGEPVYDGLQATWLKEEINLENYVGKEIKVRFKLVSDTYVVADGFFWDDMTVTVVDTETGVGNAETKPIANLHPNPASGIVSIDYDLDYSSMKSGSFLVYNNLGQKVADIRLIQTNGQIDLDVSSWKPGVYFYTFTANQALLGGGKLIVR